MKHTTRSFKELDMFHDFNVTTITFFILAIFLLMNTMTLVFVKNSTHDLRIAISQIDSDMVREKNDLMRLEIDFINAKKAAYGNSKERYKFTTIHQTYKSFNEVVRR